MQPDYHYEMLVWKERAQKAEAKVAQVREYADEVREWSYSTSRDLHLIVDAAAPEGATLAADDVRAERIEAPGQAVNDGNRGCRMIHLPTGIVAYGTDPAVSYLQNSRSALDELTRLVALAAVAPGGEKE